MELHPPKKFLHCKDDNISVKIHAMEWEKTHVNYRLDKGLISKIQQKPLQ